MKEGWGWVDGCVCASAVPCQAPAVAKGAMVYVLVMIICCLDCDRLGTSP